MNDINMLILPVAIQMHEVSCQILNKKCYILSSKKIKQIDSIKRINASNKFYHAWISNWIITIFTANK